MSKIEDLQKKIKERTLSRIEFLQAIQTPGMPKQLSRQVVGYAKDKPDFADLLVMVRQLHKLLDIKSSKSSVQQGVRDGLVAKLMACVSSGSDNELDLNMLKLMQFLAKSRKDAKTWKQLSTGPFNRLAPVIGKIMRRFGLAEVKKGFAEGKDLGFACFKRVALMQLDNLPDLMQLEGVQKAIDAAFFEPVSADRLQFVYHVALLTGDNALAKRVIKEVNDINQDAVEFGAPEISLHTTAQEGLKHLTECLVIVNRQLKAGSGDQGSLSEAKALLNDKLRSFMVGGKLSKTGLDKVIAMITGEPELKQGQQSTTLPFPRGKSEPIKPHRGFAGMGAVSMFARAPDRGAQPLSEDSDDLKDSGPKL